MTIKGVFEKIKNAESVEISIPDEDWAPFGENAKVAEFSGSPDAVSDAAKAHIDGGEFKDAQNVATVLFCNPEDSLLMMGAIPADEISATGVKAHYCVCCAPLESGKVEMYLISK